MGKTFRESHDSFSIEYWNFDWKKHVGQIFGSLLLVRLDDRLSELGYRSDSEKE